MRPRSRDRWALVVIALSCALLVVSPIVDRVHGLSLDLLTALRWHVSGQRHPAVESPTVVVAIDEQTYTTPPFAGSPTITWTREIGRVLTAIVDQGAAVVGFDVVFPSSIEQSEIPFGDDSVGARFRGFDRDFLRALRAAASAGRLVLGEVQHGEQPIRPAPGQRVAVGQQLNIRSLNVYSDADDVVRRLPTSFASADGGREPSMALELAARAMGVRPSFDAAGHTRLAAWRIPEAVPRAMTLSFEGGADDIPTFSLADLRACVEQGNTDFFRRHFAGKVVIVGTLLDIEDRKTTTKRLATGVERAGAARCALAPPATAAAAARQTVSGVYIHATAVNNLIRRDALVEPSPGQAFALVVVLAAVAAGAALHLAPATAALITLAAASVLVGVALVALRWSIALPLVEPLLAALAALAVAVGYRFVAVDREERLLRRSFGLYLSPKLIDRMVETERLPALGGEMREVTALFSDIAGFSSFSETMTPQALVSLMNEYLSAMTEIIESCGGYVDKYVGDSIVAVFGAPIDDADHAGSAVRAALRCRERLEAMNRDPVVFQGHHIEHRIGINSGQALVGNIGSRQRFNYTVMSDAVNLASRLEGANKYFSTSILVSETTVDRTGSAFDWREIDAVRVKGRVQPVRVFELLAHAGGCSAAQRACCQSYDEGLAAWRSRDFEAAARAFARHASEDPAAAMFERRSLELAARPPGPGWEPVYSLEGK